MSEHDLAVLITDVKESLEREIQGLAREMREAFAQVNTRFDTQAVRLDRHAALEAKDREIADLRDRLKKLEDSTGR
jgi:hypothetical protein